MLLIIWYLVGSIGSGRRIGLLRWACGRASMGLVPEHDRFSCYLFCYALGGVGHCCLVDRTKKGCSLSAIGDSETGGERRLLDAGAHTSHGGQR